MRSQMAVAMLMTPWKQMVSRHFLSYSAPGTDNPHMSALARHVRVKHRHHKEVHSRAVDGVVDLAGVVIASQEKPDPEPAPEPSPGPAPGPAPGPFPGPGPSPG